VLRVTADTNIFISALNFKGKPFDLLTLARVGRIEIAMSDQIMAEIKRVLRLKFEWPDEDVVAIERQIVSFTKRVEPTLTVDLINVDPTDNRILECAAAGRSGYIVSGDNHLLNLKQCGNIKIINVADFSEGGKGLLGDR
jgi:putative PIN family toxin of toxin-antitoxin system